MGRAAALAMALAIAAPATAAVLVSNIDQTVQGNESLSTFNKAQAFTTGPGTGGYTLTSVDVKFHTAPGTNLSVTVRQGTARGTVVATLTNPSSLATGNLTFTAPTGTTLAASTTYFLFFGGSGAISSTDIDAEDSGGARGWSIADHGLWLASGTDTEVSSLLIGVNGSPVDMTPPTFVTAWADGTALTLLFDEPLGTATLANTAFAVKKRGADGTESTVDLGATAPSVSGSTVVLTLASALASTDRRVTVAYTKPTAGSGNRIVDAVGNEAGSFAEYVPDVLVSTIGQPSQSATAPLNGETWASGFVTGANSTGYTLASVELKFDSAPDSRVRVRIFNVVDSSAGQREPGTTLIAALTNPSLLAAGNLRFTAPGTTLTAGTNYAVVVDSATSGALNFTTTGARDAGGEADWQLGHGRQQGGMGAWSARDGHLQMRLSGTPNPPCAVGEHAHDDLECHDESDVHQTPPPMDPCNAGEHDHDDLGCHDESDVHQTPPPMDPCNAGEHDHDDLGCHDESERHTDTISSPRCTRAEGLIVGGEPVWLEGTVLEVDTSTHRPDRFHFLRLDLPTIQPLTEVWGWNTGKVCLGGGLVCMEGLEGLTCDEDDEDCVAIPPCGVLDEEDNEVAHEDGRIWMKDYDLRWSENDLIQVRWPYGLYYEFQCRHTTDGGKTWEDADCHPLD